jgi:hypothetical protein
MRRVVSPREVEDGRNHGLLGVHTEFDALADGVNIIARLGDLVGIAEQWGMPLFREPSGEAKTPLDTFAKRLRAKRLRQLVEYPVENPLEAPREVWEGQQLAVSLTPAAPPKQPEWLLPATLDEVMLAQEGARAGVAHVRMLLATVGDERDVGQITHPLHRRLTLFQGLDQQLMGLAEVQLDPRLFTS